MRYSTIAEFVSHLNSLDIQLSLTGEPNASPDQIRLHCSAASGSLTPELRQALIDHKADLIAYLQTAINPGSFSSTSPTSPSLRAHSTPPCPTSHHPLSFAQQRLWFLYQLTPNNPFYNVPAAIRLSGNLDQTALERAFNCIVQRHATLRTRFVVRDGEPAQIILSNVQVDFSTVDLHMVPSHERDQISQQLAAAEAHHPFNLTVDAPLRVSLLQFEPTEALLLLTMHHIVADGWSIGVLIRELAHFYAALVEGRTPSLPALPIQYTDFVYWQYSWLQGEVLEHQLAYWRNQLRDLPMLNLPSDRPRPAVQTYRGATQPLQISPSLTQQLVSLSQQAGVSLFMTLLAAFQTLLHRYTEQDDIAVGVPIANRHHSDLEGLIGFFVNSLVMRSDLSGNPTFRGLLERVRITALKAYEHQDLPFEKLVEALDPERDLSHNPLFQVAFALQNAPVQALELSGLRLDPAPLETASTRFDLEIHLWEPTQGLRSLWQSQDGLSGFISYSTDLFDSDRIHRLIGHFQTLLAGIVANPEARLSDLPLLTPFEYQQIVAWNQTETQSTNLCFHHIFETQVQQSPEAIALVSESECLTYRELDERANQLAQILQQMGVQPNTLVGLAVDRSADMIIGILGILKAGGAYVPLDPNYPEERLHFMLTDTQVPILLTQSWLIASLPTCQAKLLCLEQLCLEQTLGFPTFSSSSIPFLQQHPVSAGNFAYVIYTSGSTGVPKGVLLSHRGLSNVVQAQQQLFDVGPNSRILQFSSLSFDASVFEIALAFGSGGTLYIPPKSAQLPGSALVQFLQDHAITHALLTPAVLAVLPAVELPALQVLITGGEACSQQILDRWATNRRFFNAYGPTEITIFATAAELHPGEHASIIGRPIANTRLYILDAHLNPVPIGVPGELYISGAGVAEGYLNRPELTEERFVSLECSRLYKTGDRARYRSDGSIEFLGRGDTQVKIRGFRVEMGEIEAALQRHPAIQDAVVIASDAGSSETRLIAYFSLDLAKLNLSHVVEPLQSQQLQYWQTLYDQTYQAKEGSQEPGARSQEWRTSSEQTGQAITEKARNIGLEIKQDKEQDQTAIQTGEADFQSDAKFDITGWNSSYTGEPIPSDQMQEWVNDRVQQILALQPRRVLEIGCGTGLLLLPIAPQCQKYVGTDFSPVVLQSLQHQLDRLDLPQVELLHRTATDFDGIDAASFDLVILNSIVQYFPSREYLMQVLEAAVQAVAPGGHVLVGDVRSLPLLTAFHTWMQFSQADGSMERTQLQSQVERSQFEESELAIDPRFFYALSQRFPQIRQVQVRLSRGRSLNEMTQFRYNVLLHVAEVQEGCNRVQSPAAQQLDSRNSTGPAAQHNWKLASVSVADVQELLAETKPETYLITNITNSRVSHAIQTANWLYNPALIASRTAPKTVLKTVGRMREWLQANSGNHSENYAENYAELGIDPEDWWNLETLLPYRIEITWSAQTNTGDYDVLFIRHGVEATIDFPLAEIPDRFCDAYTNYPLQSQLARQLVPELRQSLKQTLPDYMVPAALIPLATLPRTTNGKVDRAKIITLYETEGTAPDGIQPINSAAIAAPTSNYPVLSRAEAMLVDIWKELLHLKQVNTSDNFFELGGHSLLATQMASRIRDLFDVELPLQSVFETPTIAQLAALLESRRAKIAPLPMPPLVRLDRSLYRRKSSRFATPQNREEGQGEQPLISDQLISDQLAAKTATASSPLVALTLGGSQSPFFCIHPMFGVVFPYLELAHHLGQQRSFYGLQSVGLSGNAPPLNRIEAMAAYYIEAIQRLQPHGPYYLGGWSFGGLVAFEMAQQLTQAGQSVGLLAILDTPAPCYQPSFSQSLKFLLGTALWSGLPFLLNYGAIATQRWQSQAWLSRWQWAAITRLLPQSRLRLLDESAIVPMLRIFYANAQAAYRYMPQYYPHRITVFKTAESVDKLRSDPMLGWQSLANDVQLHSVPGNHLSLLQPPHVQVLAEKLGQCLAENP